MTKPLKLAIIYLPVTDLVKLKDNPRIDKDPEAIKRLANLIKAHGFQNPLQIFRSDGKNEIIVGNHRFDAGLSLGMKEFPCIVYEGNRDQALARAISDNQSNTWTDWNVPTLKDLLIELDGTEIDMSITGFNAQELELMMTAIKMDEPADAEAQVDSEYYTLTFKFLKDDAAFVTELLHDEREKHTEDLGEGWREICLMRLLK